MCRAKNPDNMCDEHFFQAVEKDAKRLNWPYPPDVNEWCVHIEKGVYCTCKKGVR